MSTGAPQHGENDFMDIQARQYVSLYIQNQGAFGGYLRPKPASRNDFPQVPHRMYIQLPHNRQFYADLEPLEILLGDELTDSRYYIDIENPYVVSAKFQLSPPVNEDHMTADACVMVLLHYSDHAPHYTFYAKVAYFNGRVADWKDPVRYRTIVEAHRIVEERNLQRILDQQHNANNQHTRNRQRNHGNNRNNPDPEAEHEYWGFFRK